MDAPWLLLILEKQAVRRLPDHNGVPCGLRVLAERPYIAAITDSLSTDVECINGAGCLAIHCHVFQANQYNVLAALQMIGSMYKLLMLHPDSDVQRAAAAWCNNFTTFIVLRAQCEESSGAFNLTIRN